MSYRTKIRQSNAEGDSVTAKRYVTKQKSAVDSIAQIGQAYIRLNPGSLVSLFLLDWNWNKLGYPLHKELLNNLADSIQQHSLAQSLKQRLAQVERVQSGRKAPVFSGATVKGGELISLALGANHC